VIATGKVKHHAVSSVAPKDQHFYVVLETQRGVVVVTELTQDKSCMWSVNPEDLEARNSLAKVLRVADSHGSGITVGDLKSSLANAGEPKRVGATSSHACRRKYAADIYDWAARRSSASSVEPQRYCAELLCSFKTENANGFKAEMWTKKWVELAEAERQAAKLLGIKGASTWNTLAWDRGHLRRELGGVWETRWAKLAEEEQNAAAQLGIQDVSAWWDDFK